jgi:hypothetical protein
MISCNAVIGGLPLASAWQPADAIWALVGTVARHGPSGSAW